MILRQQKKCFSGFEDTVFIAAGNLRKRFSREEVAGGIIPQPAVNGAARPLYPPLINFYHKTGTLSTQIYFQIPDRYRHSFQFLDAEEGSGVGCLPGSGMKKEIFIVLFLLPEKVHLRHYSSSCRSSLSRP